MSGVKVEVDESTGVATVTIDEPERRNSLNTGIVEGLVGSFDRLEADPAVGAVVITGAPPAFCAGADLGDLGGSQEAGLRAIYEGFLRVGRSPLPTLAAVNGAAVGAGMNLALCCDVRLAGRAARFDTRFLELGLHPGGGHTWMLERAVGPSAASALVVFGTVIHGAEAERIGLVWKCVDDDALLDAAGEMAARAASAPHELTRRVKATMAAMPGVATHPDAVDLELEAQVWSLGQPFFAERLAALQARIKNR